MSSSITDRKFDRYEDVPVIIADTILGIKETIFATSCSTSLGQPISSKSYVGDHFISLCAEVDNVFTPEQFVGLKFEKGSSYELLVGARDLGTQYESIQTGVGGGSRTQVAENRSRIAMPLAKSVGSIESGSKIIFPNEKVESIVPSAGYINGNILTVSGDFSKGDTHIGVICDYKSFNLTGQRDCSRGEITPKREYSADGPVQGNLDLQFYLNTGNLQSFFNITGAISVLQYPTINEQPVQISVGNYVYSDAYLKNFSFDVVPNEPVVAKASYSIFGEAGVFAPLLPIENNNQKSLPHGLTSKVDGSEVGITSPISFSYSVDVDRTPEFNIPQYGHNAEVQDPNEGEMPSRVNKNKTLISAVIVGEKMDTEFPLEGKRVKVGVILKDLSYKSSFSDNNQGVMQSFEVDGVVKGQSLNVADQGFLTAQVEVVQEYR
tara:strand:+ start:2352 stop:3659 length:1308 start_codon:yes stop_codon:yes gene_type:complete